MEHEGDPSSGVEPRAAPSRMRDGSPEAPRGTRTYGFRMSVVDGVILVVGLGATWPLWSVIGPFALLVPYVVLHFFLFCNVFRIRRGSELVWAFLLLIQFAGALLSFAFLAETTWWVMVAVQTAATVVILVIEVRHPGYHGVFSRPPEEATADSGPEAGSPP